MLIIITGFFMGFIHVLAGPDHLAAISPLAVEKKTSCWRIGLKWGLGHTGGVFLVGLLVFLFREIIPMDSISSFSERIVGIVLIGIGLWGLQKIVRLRLHMHRHDHGRSVHFHFHTHSEELPHDDPKAHFHSHTALIVGIVHGLAGSSHLLGVLPALAMPTKFDAAMYLVNFGLGTIASMVIFSEFIGRFANRWSGSRDSVYRGISVSFNVLAIAIGIFWLIK